MIPKIINYCWFGRGEKSKLVIKCIESWKKYAPDFEIIEWNEDNFDIESYPYAKYCYDNQKWAFLSDFARLIIIYENGGVYFDTDVELIKPIDCFLSYEAFFGFEDDQHINTGEGFGATRNHPVVGSMIEIYQALEKEIDGIYPCIPCPALNTEALLKYGLVLNGEYQQFNGIVILPSDYMNPYDDPTGRLLKTMNTVSIHWYSKSWISKRLVLRSKIMKPIHRLLGKNFFHKEK